MRNEAKLLARLRVKWVIKFNHKADEREKEKKEEIVGGRNKNVQQQSIIVLSIFLHLQQLPARRSHKRRYTLIELLMLIVSITGNGVMPIMVLMKHGRGKCLGQGCVHYFLDKVEK